MVNFLWNTKHTGNKPWSGPMMAKFTDAYMRHSASMASLIGVWLDMYMHTYIYNILV